MHLWKFNSPVLLQELQGFARLCVARMNSPALRHSVATQAWVALRLAVVFSWELILRVHQIAYVGTFK
jgi:hypothetical protein